MSKEELAPEVREYFRRIGRIRGNALKEQYGSEYFRQISLKRKTFGRKPAEDGSTLLSKKYGVSRQRIHQIFRTHGQKFATKDYPNRSAWRQAVLTDYFKNK